MMRTFFTSLTCLLALFLSGCGFSPMHTAANSNTSLANLDIQLEKGSSVVDNQAGFYVTQRLRDRIGTSNETTPYALKITPIYSRSRLGLTDADVASRYDITVVARWALVDKKTGKMVKRGRASARSSFGAPEGPYGVITADNVGVEQSAKETADQLILQLARYFASEKA